MMHLLPAAAAILLAGAAEPPFPNSVVSNDLEFIAADDPAAPGRLRYLGRFTQEMAGALDTDELMASGVHTFEATFADGARVGLWVHPSVGPREEAEKVAALLVGPLGRLPAIILGRLSHVVIHSGDGAAFGEHLGHFFAVYEDNVRARIATHDLEETVFHESVHATLDLLWADSAVWRDAQSADGAFVTDCATENPDAEDLAESALFAFAHLRHPGRLPPRRGGGRAPHRARAARPPRGDLRRARA